MTASEIPSGRSSVQRACGAWRQAGVGLALVLIVGGCAPGRRPVSRAWTTMGTFAGVSLPAAEESRLDEAVKTCRTIFKELDEALTVYVDDSELMQVNRAAGSGPVDVSPQVCEAVAAALKYAVLSGGAFDPTVAPLVRFWGFNDGTAPAALPAPEVVGQILETVGYRHVSVVPPDSRGGGSVGLARPGMSLDLGGIAKGLAVDGCFERLKADGMVNVMVDLGGNIRCGGHARGGRRWRIGVRNPFNREELLGVLELPDGAAVATSGNYERFVEIDGVRYTHILDPRTGYPVKRMAGVTVVANTAVEADALSTAFFVMGTGKAVKLLETLPGCSALFVENERTLNILITPDFQSCFTPDAKHRKRVRLL